MAFDGKLEFIAAGANGRGKLLLQRTSDQMDLMGAQQFRTP
jgi:hypothetical protein